MINKVQLRKKLLKQRRSLSVEVWQDKSDRLCDHLRSLTLFQDAQTILAYFSFRQEPTLDPLFSLEKKWGFPRCVQNQLQWHCWQPKEPTEIGKYGVKTPLSEASQIDPQTVDLLLIPAIACDRQGYRLGYGGGYYDRLLTHPQWCNIPTIGIIFNFAYLPQLPYDPWDQRLQGVCTEVQYFHTV